MRTIDCFNSSNITAMTYDEDTQDLTVHFQSGSYMYLGVSQLDADQLEAADSKGAYVARNIKPNHQVVKL